VNDSKVCLCCGLPFEKRKKWNSNWDEVKYCSEKCRKQVNSKRRKDLENIFNGEIAKLKPKSSFCLSVVAQKYREENWKMLMEELRQIARLATHNGKTEILQNDKPVAPHKFKGPIRVRAKVHT